MGATKRLSAKPTVTGLGPEAPTSEATTEVDPPSLPTVVRPRSTPNDTIKDIAVKRCLECGARFGIDARFCPFDGGALDTATWDPTRDPLAGKVIDQRYEVLGPLGEGGMGTVYRVRHVTLNRIFALKVLRRDLATDAELAARFVQEARATAAIKHPSVVAITDFGALEDGTPYFVMELLEGETLATWMHARGPLSPHVAAGIARKIADALAASHSANVIHRDLKPENVFLVGAIAGRAAEDEIRIVDFGAAKVIGGACKLTRPGIVFGTPYYMSPEQASGSADIDARADVYSLGVLLYEMLTGNVPFEADTYMGVLTKHMFAEPVSPSEKCPGVHLGPLEGVTLRALAKEPSDRFASMIELSSALATAERGRSSESPRPNAPIRPTLPLGSMSAADRMQVSIGRRVAEEARRKRRLVAISVVAACGTLGIGAAIAVTLSGTSPSGATAARPSGTTTPPAHALSTGPPSSVADSRTDIPPPPAPSEEPSRVAMPDGLSSAVTGSNGAAPSRKPSQPSFPTTPPTRSARAGSTAPVPTGRPASPSTPPQGPEDFRDPWADPPKR